MITIVDYGLGNIRAFENVYKRLNVNTKIAYRPKDLKDAHKIILPGVGAFDYAMQMLNDSGMREELDRQVIEHKKPIMGICVGMQMLAKSSEEGVLPGLNWIDGTVKRFNPETIPYKTRLPHMGWNNIVPVNRNAILEGFNEDSRFYFLHSYYFVCHDEKDIIAKSKYGVEYASGINSLNVYGIQFHPEKSHSNGIRLLYNFSKL